MSVSFSTRSAIFRYRLRGVISAAAVTTLAVGLLSPVGAQAATGGMPAPRLHGERGATVRATTRASSTPATRASEVATAGRSSVGDSLFPTIGNRGYRVSHYAIQLRYLPSTKSIRATTTIRARASHRLSTFSLDLEKLTVTKVVVNGHRSTFRRHADKLLVTPAHAVRGRFTTTVDYRGRPVTHIDPDGAKDGWVPTGDGATVLSEPVGAMTWFPDNNTPRDKATFSMAITVPKALAVAANGDLTSRHRHGDSTTWTWKQRKQMATYLAMVSIGRYHVYHSTMRTTSGHKLPIWSFVDPRLGTLSRQRRLIPSIIRFEERRFGHYPFTSVGIVVKNVNVGYALETQNRPFFDGTPDTSTIVHELAHQWYGDSVTPRDWGDIWLNEGFATYAESLWGAAHGGQSTRAQFLRTYRANPASSPLWSPAPAALSDPADLFSDPVYVRGGMTLEALRERVGSKDFFTILRRWSSREAGKSVSTADFIALAERVSNANLSGLFTTWLYVARRPTGY